MTQFIILYIYEILQWERKKAGNSSGQIKKTKFVRWRGSKKSRIFDFKSKIIPLVIVLLNVIARKAIETILSFGKPETFTEYLILNT